MPYIHHIYFEEAGAGTPVILVHCPGVSHVLWRPVIDRLQSSCRAIAMDVRGHGRSGRGDRPWRFADIAGDIALLADELGLDRPLLVGYSAGSAIALQAALDSPDRYSGLVLIGGFSECSSLQLAGKALVGLAAVRLGLTDLVTASIVRTNHTSGEHSKAMLPDAERVSPVALASFLRETVRAKVTHRLPEAKLPVLLVYGEKDTPMRPYYCKLQEGLPQARSVFFRGVDHRVPTRRPDDLADAITAFAAEIATDAVSFPVGAFPGAQDYPLHP